MDIYPEDYINHNLPLVILSGLGSQQPFSIEESRSSYPLLADGFQISCGLPPVLSPLGDLLLENFLELGAESGSWIGRRDQNAFQVRAVGREYKFPPRKARPPTPNSPTLSPSLGSPDSAGGNRMLTPILHSPISPLSPSSPIYPDGVMTPSWVYKHQTLVPWAFVAFFSFFSDPNLDSLQDNQLKTEISSLKKSIGSASNGRTRLVVVMISQKSIMEAPEISERLATIRRTTGVDAKSLFFLPPDSSAIEITTFIKSMLVTLEPFCVEYYRDLSKHARRKRNRSNVPPPTAPPVAGTSQTLPSQGWNVRYSFKMGVFAEFRQEIDVAGKNYEDAYEALFRQDVFGSIASWSPRWNEARLLADILAIRIIRCHLWIGQTTLAVQKWVRHRRQMEDIVDQKGKGSRNYGWFAWEARWAKIMAEMIKKVEVPALFTSESKHVEGENVQTVIFAVPEKPIALIERARPQDLLHHPGYWLRRSTRYLRSRRMHAESMPDEDRASPGQSPASRVANRSYIYDTYLCPEPYIESPLAGLKGFDLSALIIKTIRDAQFEYNIRGQRRFSERLELEIGREQMRKGDWEEALQTLRPLWQNMSWRAESWWSAVEEVGSALKECATRTGDGVSIISVQWELMSNVFSLKTNRLESLSNCLDGIDSIKSKPAVVLRAENVTSFVSTTFAFKKGQGNVGDVLEAQFTIFSNAHEDSRPVVFSDIIIKFDGSIKTIVIHHEAEEQRTLPGSGTIQISSVSLHEAPPDHATSSPPTSPTIASSWTLAGTADLELAPSEVKAFNIKIPLREAGDGRASSATFRIAEDSFDVDYVVNFAENHPKVGWWTQGKKGSKQANLGRERPSTVNILPKPPKVRLSLLGEDKVFYTNERIKLPVQLINEEDEEADISLDIRILGHAVEKPTVQWSDAEDDAAVIVTSKDSPGALLAHPIGRLPVGSTTSDSLIILPISEPAEYVIEVKAIYHLTSDYETQITKSISIVLQIVGPFEANYDFSPRVHPDTWPSYFQVEEDILAEDTKTTEAEASGIAQKWCLTSRIVSFADENLIIQDLELVTLAVNGGSQCTIRKKESLSQELEIKPKDAEEASFDVDVQKNSLDDRRSVTLDLSLNVSWRRDSPTAAVNVTPLAVPRLLVTGGEPRVLASTTYSTIVPNLIHLDYTFENPTMHLLTFNLSMEPNEDFALSGPKFRSLQLVPLTRETVRFNLYPTVTGVWIQPILKVVDRYFNKTLRISATEGMRADKKGILVWVNAISDDILES